MIVRCPSCNELGERFGSGCYIQEDKSFKCKGCGYKGGEK